MSSPTALARTWSLIFVTLAIINVGTPSGPNGTGWVLPTRQTRAAGSAGNPRPMSMAAQMATGAPMPEVDSMKAENEKAMSRAWSLRSVESEDMELLMISNCPDSTTRL